MKSIFNLLLLTTITTVSNSYFYANQEEVLANLNPLNINKYLYRKAYEDDVSKARRYYQKPERAENWESRKYLKKHNDVIKLWKDEDVKSNEETTPDTEAIHIFRRNGQNNVTIEPTVSTIENHTKEEDDESTSISSSHGMKNWKEEWLEHWAKKKIETVNSTDNQGDKVSLLHARPWGIPCGDPHQNDAPWGTCLLMSECEPEFRIYRADVYCGNHIFGCCAILQTNYDFEEGVDFDFYDKSLSTETEEKREKAKDIDRVKVGLAMKKRRKRLRKKRQEKIVKKLEKITNDIKRVLVKLQFNSTQQRRQKTKQLKRFIKSMKQNFKDTRMNLISLHNQIIMKIDVNLMRQLNQILVVNQEFAVNNTFRNIVLTGTMTKKGERMLALAFPQLKPYLPSYRHRYPQNKRRNTYYYKNHKPMRRVMRFKKEPHNLDINHTIPGTESDPKYFEYDIEYGLLYY